MRYKINTIEPFWWGLFMLGAGIIGILLPAEIIVLGVVAPLVHLSPRFPATMTAWVSHPIVKLFLFVLISLPLFHWAHRFRYFVYDLGLHGGRMPMAWLCYGLAVLGTAYAAYVLFTF